MTVQRRACLYCGSSEHELRPYGPGGRDVCFRCATATPARLKQTERAFEHALDMAGDVAVIDAGDEAGPRAATESERECVDVDGVLSD